MNTKDLIRLGVPPGEPTRRGMEYIARYILKGLDKAKLAEDVAAVVRARPGDIHPATRTFQALRIFVNDELGELIAALTAAERILKPQGRLVAVSFHSLEDRIVKQAFATSAKGCICPPKMPVCACGKKPDFKVLTPRPIMAGPEECERNPAARSAKLRVAEKI